MKKKLDVSVFTSTLRGESVFFPTKNDTPAPDQAGEPIEHPKEEHPLPQSPRSEADESNHDTLVPRYHETIIPSNHNTMMPLSEEDMIEAVRKAVKQIGKEPATQRLTLDEKQALDDIEYSYKRQGIRTSGNEIIRIATNYIVRDYRKNGENSILAKVLNSLNY